MYLNAESARKGEENPSFLRLSFLLRVNNFETFYFTRVMHRGIISLGFHGNAFVEEHLSG